VNRNPDGQKEREKDIYKIENSPTIAIVGEKKKEGSAGEDNQKQAGWVLLGRNGAARNNIRRTRVTGDRAKEREAKLPL